MNGDICSLCCGTERENTVHCPLECPFLQEAHLRERREPMDEAAFPNRDIRITERFLKEREPLLLFLGVTILKAAAATPDAIDNDVREALAALVKTYRTLDSGLYYETRPENPIAASIQAHMQEDIQQFRKQLAEQTGMRRVSDTDILGILAFLQRLEIQHNNGRRLGRAFLDFLRGQFPEPGEPAPGQQAPLLVS